MRHRFRRGRFQCAADLPLVQTASPEERDVPREVVPVQTKIQLPHFAQELLARQTCPYCGKSFLTADVTAAGIRVDPQDKKTYFSYEVVCAKCKQPSMAMMNTRPCTMRTLADVLANMFKKGK